MWRGYASPRPALQMRLLVRALRADLGAGTALVGQPALLRDAHALVAEFSEPEAMDALWGLADDCIASSSRRAWRC